MKKMIHAGILALALVGASYGMADAYMYGITDYNPTGYPIELSEGVHLCYTGMGGGLYLNEKTVHIIAQEGDVYTISANFIGYNKERGSLTPSSDTYKYDTSTHTMYSVHDGRAFEILPRTDRTDQATYRAATKGKQIWSVAMGYEWEW